jgi:hypothetical protein
MNKKSKMQEDLREELSGPAHFKPIYKISGYKLSKPIESGIFPHRKGDYGQPESYTAIHYLPSSQHDSNGNPTGNAVIGRGTTEDAATADLGQRIASAWEDLKSTPLEMLSLDERRRQQYLLSLFLDAQTHRRARVRN